MLFYNADEINFTRKCEKFNSLGSINQLFTGNGADFAKGKLKYVSLTILSFYLIVDQSSFFGSSGHLGR